MAPGKGKIARRRCETAARDRFQTLLVHLLHQQVERLRQSPAAVDEVTGHQMQQGVADGPRLRQIDNLLHRPELDLFSSEANFVDVSRANFRLSVPRLRRQRIRQGNARPWWPEGL